VNRIARHVIMCMLLIAALAVIWNLLGGGSRGFQPSPAGPNLACLNCERKSN
jgi:hypothetical protein